MMAWDRERPGRLSTFFCAYSDPSRCGKTSRACSAKILLAGVAVAAICAARPAAASDMCAALDKLYPLPGRTGEGFNIFRPAPLFSPARPQQGAPGTLDLSIVADHVSSAPKGKPGLLWVGNYQVTDIPTWRISGGASGPAVLVDPDTGNTVPIPNICLNNPSWGYGGTQWALIQADTLDVMFHSNFDYTGKDSVPVPTNGAMPCRSSNLHIHGMLVSPYHPAKAGQGPYGDFVLDSTQPHGALDYKIGVDDCDTHLGDIPHKGHGLTDMPLHYVTTIPGQPGVNSLKSGEHPSGLFWYHPHPHGYSGFQLHGGTTGALTVGNLTDYACPTGDGSPGNCTITNTNIRVMILKDQGLQNTDGTTWTTLHDFESDLCLPTGGTRLGECQGVEGKGPPTKWVFTINGVQYPVMHDPAGRMEIWRIANTSPQVTYMLSIDPLGKSGVGSLPFQLLAKDGVAVLNTGEGPKMHTQMLLMPANRIEIAIPAPPDGGTYEFRNNVVSTAADGNNSGNVWPEMGLARITWDAQKENDAQGNEAHRTVALSAPSTPLPNGNTSTQLSPACRYDPTDTRVVNFVHRFVKVYNDGAKSRSGSGTQPSGLKPNINEVFGLITGIRHADGTYDYYPADGGPPLHDLAVVWKLGVKGFDPAFPGLGHNNYNTVCTVKGNVEHWELQNWTGEDHNFHIHQSKFTIDPAGVFQFPQFQTGDYPYVKLTDALIRNFPDKKELTYNDTVPVPRGESICATAPATVGCHNNPVTQCSGEPDAPDCPRPGQMSVLMDFSRAEQVGSFVYHCHILEHEDGGMMAPINVICPPGDSSCASQQVNAAICKPPAGL
jgi:FtsP/CotA-like multicopper oxidase with cupredoxin domain